MRETKRESLTPDPSPIGEGSEKQKPGHPCGCLGGNFSVSEYEPFKAFGSKD